MPRPQSTSTVVRHLRAIERHSRDLDFTTLPQDAALREAAARLERFAPFVAQIAQMTDESETSGGLSWDDMRPTMNSLISEARELTGIDPKHGRVFCVECQTDLDECLCDKEVPAQCSSL